MASKLGVKQQGERGASLLYELPIHATVICILELAQQWSSDVRALLEEELEDEEDVARLTAPFQSLDYLLNWGVNVAGGRVHCIEAFAADGVAGLQLMHELKFASASFGVQDEAVDSYAEAMASARLKALAKSAGELQAAKQTGVYQHRGNSGKAGRRGGRSAGAWGGRGGGRTGGTGFNGQPSTSGAAVE